jgi:hypothetical protein
LTTEEQELLDGAPKEGEQLAEYILASAPRFADGVNWGTIALKLSASSDATTRAHDITRALTIVADHVHPEVLVPLLRHPDSRMREFVASTLAAHAYHEAVPALRDAAFRETDEVVRESLHHSLRTLESTMEGAGSTPR